MKYLHVITDLQFGSTGKGLFAGFLAKRIRPDTLVTAWGPNAGHTFIDPAGNKFVNIMVPNGVIAPSVKRVLIGPGSVINPSIMLEELKRYGVPSAQIEIAIHEHATVVGDRHRAEEARYGFGIGSTMKGVGEAVIDKIRRIPDIRIVARDALDGTPLGALVVTKERYNALLDEAEIVLLEGAQGFSLSINNGFYPYTTSRECTTHQLLSDCAIPRNCWQSGGHHNGDTRQQYQTRVYGVARTFPIRVANRFDDKGNQIGWSGPCYPDQSEIKWEDIGREPELTTVTKLPRRIFTFSPIQIQQAVRTNGVDSVFLNFCNYVGAGPDLDQIIEQIEQCGPSVRWLGWGAREDQIEIVTYA